MAVTLSRCRAKDDRGAFRAGKPGKPGKPPQCSAGVETPSFVGGYVLNDFAVFVFGCFWWIH